MVPVIPDHFISTCSPGQLDWFIKGGVECVDCPWYMHLHVKVPLGSFEGPGFPILAEVGITRLLNERTQKKSKTSFLSPIKDRWYNNCSTVYFIFYINHPWWCSKIATYKNLQKWTHSGHQDHHLWFLMESSAQHKLVLEQISRNTVRLIKMNTFSSKNFPSTPYTRHDRQLFLYRSYIGKFPA
jgi:hypothetical protein